MLGDKRAERAILDRAEAYRLVEEAREQRERADRAELALAEMREALDRWRALVGERARPAVGGQ